MQSIFYLVPRKLLIKLPITRTKKTNNYKKKKSGQWGRLFGVKCAGGRGNTTYTPGACLAPNFNLRSPSVYSSITVIFSRFQSARCTILMSVL